MALSTFMSSDVEYLIMPISVEVNLPQLRREFVEPDLQKFIGYIPMGPYLEFYYDYDTCKEDLQNTPVTTGR